MAGEKGRILLVDDDRDTCANLVDILSVVGYTVDVAYDGASALERVEQFPYKLALLDLKMPGMDGLELLKRIRERRKDTTALIVTAFASQDTEQEAARAGAWRIVSKPVDVPRLIGLLDEAAGGPLVLVVDDDPELCGSLADVFGARQFRVAVAHSVAEAQRRMESTRFEVVLIDLKLPGADGGHLFRYVRQHHPHARTILITGFRDEMAALVEAARREGADAVCYKPFDVGQLVKTVQSLSR